MRLSEVGASHHKLLRTLSAGISNRLEATFSELPRVDAPTIGIELRERGKRVMMELPVALLLQADTDRAVREQMRLRIKAQRDRMLTRAEPAFLSTKSFGSISSLGAPGGSHGPGRYRR